MFDEVIDDSKPYTIFDPVNTWKQKTVESFRAVPLREQIFKRGKNMTKPKPLQEIQAYCKKQVDTLWPEVLRFDHPHKYYVDLLKNCGILKQNCYKKTAVNKEKRLKHSIAFFV